MKGYSPHHFNFFLPECTCLLFKAAGMALQGGWTRWESIEPRSLSWSEIWSMEPMLSRFLIKSTYDALPSPSNLAIWGLATDSKCHRCQQKATLMHILSWCPKQLSIFTVVVGYLTPDSDLDLTPDPHQFDPRVVSVIFRYSYLDYFVPQGTLQSCSRKLVPLQKSDNRLPP